ncbi:histone deacetylase family protein [Alkalilimnicola sp. S0819]|uniref:histone deacetylase family protein n=1 Tax=Alkalilimnicola sp. S0819 TaxID=2613922 RepID=UPI001261D1F3|nr:histone deacetylase family protein [Alkalilimnicola sp. S0819]KAB7624451.1 histone deacetylase family protein [Alkalilimnicola sp. S0819]MPQ16285.1 histone deacetylase family protein [Alkalilimnicola sp. S0819]
MNTWLYTHPACLEHDTGPGHPESAARLRAVLSALEAPRFQDLQRHEPPRATREQLQRVHTADYVNRVLSAVPTTGQRTLDADTLLSPGSGEAALRAAGALTDAVDQIMAGALEHAFCAVRPPGHHAEAARAMGFCLFNNVMVGAAQAAAVHGLERIAVVDFDVHHGNGSQHMITGRAPYRFFSSQQSPLYPGTGSQNERGEQNCWNVPLAPGAGSKEFREAWETTLLPALDHYAPQLILVSAGFDGHALDPLAGLELHAEDYGWLTEALCRLARQHSEGRLISTLEGGYHLQALAECAAAHVEALL